jgi:hypothetical protein
MFYSFNIFETNERNDGTEFEVKYCWTSSQCFFNKGDSLCVNFLEILTSQNK